MRNPMAKKATGLLQKALATAQKKGASAGRLSLHHSQSIGCLFENGRLKKADTEQRVSVSVELVVDGREGRSSCNSLEDLDEVVERALSLAKAGSAVHFDAYPPPAALTPVKTHSQRTAALSRQSMIESSQKIVDAIRKYDPELFIEAGAGRQESEGVLVTSGGVCHRAEHSAWQLDALVQRTEGTDMLFSDFGRSWKDLNEFYDPYVLIAHILEDLRNARQVAPAPTGPATALLSPDMLAPLLAPAQMGINGRYVAKGDSPLRGRLGERILDPCFTIVDDPHLDYCNGAGQISDDGIPTRKMAIVDGGVLKTFLYDLDSAAMAAAEPTGHNNCSPHSIDVAPGRRPSEELLASIGDGIYIKQLMGFGQSNIINGDFSSNVALGYRIRNGEIVGRVKNTMVAGNVYELLKDKVHLSSDKDPVRRMPYAVLEGIQVSAAEQK